MMVFMGLRSICDVNDRFLWEPDLIKAILYPNIPIKMVKTLAVLENKGLVERYTDPKTKNDYGILLDPERLTRLTRHICHREEETPGYAEWRLAVLERDLYTCQGCGKNGCKLCIHHIKSYKDFPELRIDIGNGITLCEGCHKKKHRKEANRER
jgi:5-methylcytosine-specific restriction endonuclease McrA